jgi:CheY-like chemotaxis protein
MSLNGNLEDLPLRDILQIVAFSQKTGFLTVQSAHGEAALVFRQGLIVSSYTWDSPPLDPVLATQTPTQSRTRSEVEGDPIVRQRIEIALERLSRLREGPFCFEITTEPPQQIGGRDLSRETLTRGLNPQEILLDLAQGIDEDRRDSVAAVESAFAEPSTEALERVSVAGEGSRTESPEDDLIVIAVEGEELPAAPAPPVLEGASERHRLVLLLEDEADVRRVLADAFIQAGCQVVEAGDPLSAVAKARGLADMGLPFVLVADRGMPTSDGSSFQGGLEVVKRLQQAEILAPVLLMTDRMTRALHVRARKMGINRFIFKPGLSQLDPAQFEADLRAFADRILVDLLPGLEDMAEAPRPAAPASVHLPRSLEAWDEVAALQRRLEQLSGPRDAYQVSALVIKVAREFFERSLLFVVKDEELRGLTGFGPAEGDEISLVARDLVIPLNTPSVFEEVVSSRRAWSGPLPEREWGLLEPALGRIRSGAVALVPLLTHRETIALLLGDNPDTGAEFRRLETLEVFLNQAGLALENAFLQRKLKTRMRAGPTGTPEGFAGVPGLGADALQDLDDDPAPD